MNVAETEVAANDPPAFIVLVGRCADGRANLLVSRFPDVGAKRRIGAGKPVVPSLAFPIEPAA